MAQYHSWLESLEKERRGNAVLDAIFDKEFIIVRATPQHQRQKIDRFHIHKTDAMIIHRVDYKIEYMTVKTGNIALENVSVERDGIVEAEGWIHTTIADLIVYYIVGWERVVLIKTVVLRARWDEIAGAGHLYAKTTTDRDERGIPLARPYNTWNYCPRAGWLHKNGFFEKIENVTNLQLGLF